MTDFSHHIRNATVGIFNERKKLLRHMLEMAAIIDNKKQLHKRMVIGELTECIRGQMACIRRMDLHLERILTTLLMQAKKNNTKKEEEGGKE